MSALVLGLDCSSPCTVASASCLRTQGVLFAGRYYSRTTQIAGKVLTKSEAVLLSQSGLQIVAIYEDDPTSAAYFTAARGTADAEGAIAQAAAVGQPAGSAIYFTVDYDAAAADISNGITLYFAAVAAALAGRYTVGIYGSGAVCTAIAGAGSAQLAWLAQSMGWSGSPQFKNWDIAQGPAQSLCGIDVDRDVARGPFGAFTVDDSAAGELSRT